MIQRCITGWVWLGFMAGTLFGADPVRPEALRGLAASYLHRQPAAALPAGLSEAQALAAQEGLVRLLAPELGVRAGYKVGLVTAAGQARFGLDHPVRGVLFRAMLLTNGSVVSSGFATRPILEPDLIVRVGSAEINQARTIAEAARHLSELVVFIELADATFATNVAVDAGMLVASNVGARAGILGESCRMESSPEFMNRLAQMRLVLRDSAGQELSRAEAAGIMGHPLNALLWLLKDLRQHGAELQPGDLVSLGSPSPQVTPKAGESFTLTYEGLPGGPLRASVSIR